MPEPSDTTLDGPDFASLYEPLANPVFDEIVRGEIAQGADAGARARDYVDRGKPEFVLAFLLLSELPEAEKRELFAQAHEQRAINTERRAKEFDRKFHRPFPLLNADATHDRATARAIRAGKPIERGAGRQLPLM
ncbi:MAG TPA: hypothetical protein VFY89_04035 [Ktedonobacterales bacterium]